MVLAGGDDEVLGLLLLQDEPHALHIVAGIAPVAKAVEVTQVELVLEALGNAGGSKGDLAGDEGLATALALVVEEDAVAAKHIIALAIVLHNPEAIELGNSVGAAGIEGCGLALGHLLDESVELGSGGLVDAAGVGKTGNADGLQQTQDAHGIGISGELGDVEGDLHVALGREVVDLVGTDLADDADEGGGVGHVAPVEVDKALLAHVAHPLVQVQVLDAARVEARRAS